MQQDEIYFLAKTFQQAKKTFYNYHELNEFEAKQDIEDFAALAVQFPMLDCSEFEAAIRNAYKLQLEKRENPPVGVYARDIQLSILAVKGQCNAIVQAKQTRQSEAMQLEAPKPETLSPERWLAEIFPQLWENTRDMGSMATFPPIWNPQVFGQDLPELTAMSKALGNDPRFDADAKAQALRQTVTEFLKSFNLELLAKELDPINFDSWTLGRDFNLAQARTELQTLIDRHNEGRVRKIDFDVPANYHRAKRVALVVSYGQIFHGLKSPQNGQKSKVVNNAGLMANLKGMFE